MSDSNQPAALASTEAARPGASKTRKWLLLAAKLLVAGLAFTYVLTRQSWDELLQALGRVTPPTLAASVLLQVLCLSTATLRWRSLLRAYGSVHLPRLRSLMRAYFVGQFYNIYLPGAVGGDVLRGVATRAAFSENSATMSVAVVFVERAIGLSSILLAVALAVPFEVGSHVARDFLPYLALGVVGVIALIFGIAQAPRLAHYMPRRIATIMRGLPVLQNYGALAFSLLVSLLIQFLLIGCGHVVVSAIYPEVRFTDSMLVVPLAAAAAFFPLSIAGSGPRDAALVGLYALFGVPRAAAAATALVLLFTVLLVAGSGGILQLLSPLTVEKPDA